MTYIPYYDDLSLDRVSTLSPEMLEAIEDARLRRNLIGPFKTAEEAVAAMLEE